MAGKAEPRGASRCREAGAEGAYLLVEARHAGGAAGHFQQFPVAVRAGYGGGGGVDGAGGGDGDLALGLDAAAAGGAGVAEGEARQQRVAPRQEFERRDPARLRGAGDGEGMGTYVLCR